MELKQHFDMQKAIEVVLYVSERCADKYALLKILFFADKDHLGRYGRLICDDRYRALEFGPTPDGAYDIIQIAGGRSRIFRRPPKAVAGSLRLDGNCVVPLREPNIDLLSPSDIECLDDAIAEYGHLGFAKLKAISHEDTAYNDTDQNELIPMKSLVESVPNGRALWESLTSE